MCYTAKAKSHLYHKRVLLIQACCASFRVQSYQPGSWYAILQWLFAQHSTCPGHKRRAHFLAMSLLRTMNNQALLKSEMERETSLTSRSYAEKGRAELKLSTNYEPFRRYNFTLKPRMDTILRKESREECVTHLPQAARLLRTIFQINRFKMK